MTNTTTDPFREAVDRIFPKERSPTEERPESHYREPVEYRVDTRGGAWQIATRRARRGDWLHPFDPLWWQGAEDTIEIGTIDEIEALFTHPHPGIRQIVATHPMVWRDVREQMANDEWPEVRAAVLRNPRLEPDLVEQLCNDNVVGVAALAAQRRRGDTDPSEIDGCVECGRTIRNEEFRTCSIRCSIDQRERRIDSGFWVDAIAADFRHTTGLRSDWPDSFIWPVAASPASGGLPGTGPRHRDTLVSFIRGVSAAEIVDFAATVRRAGLNQRQVLDGLAVAGHEIPGIGVLNDAAETLGLERKPSPPADIAG